MSELWTQSAAEMHRLLLSGEASSREILDAHLQRIDEVNPSSNALTVILTEHAQALADKTDRLRMRGQALGPLAGIPVTVKENQDLIGSATTMGLAPLTNAIADVTSPHLEELLNAGAIPIGRSNMPEFGMRWHTDNAIAGATVNPWHPQLTPGGSSGGDAVAVATGMAPIGIGNDGAGSLRWPAQCCGVAALKPSQGRVSVAGARKQPQPLPFAFQLMGTHGPIARQVEDLKLCFQHMCAHSAGDPWHTPAPFEGPRVPRPIRIGMVLQPGGAPPHEGISKALHAASAQLKDAGYTVEETDLPELQRISEIYTQIMSQFGRLTPEPQRLPVGVISADYDQFWAAFNEPWEAAAGEITHDPMMERASLAQRWATLMADTPLLLAPIATQPAWPVGSDLEPAFHEDWLQALRPVIAVNLLGLPSVALPVGIFDGLPHGIQIIGPRFREDLCLQAAQAIEDRLPAFTPIDPR